MGATAKVAAKSETISPLDYEQLAAFRHALRRFLTFSAEAAQEAGLTPNQHQALLSVKSGGMAGLFTVGQLADHLLVAPHTAAELASRLEADGMLRKVADRDDRRRVGLELTAKAELALRQLTGVHLEEVRVIAPGLIDTLESLLQPPASSRRRSTQGGRDVEL